MSHEALSKAPLVGDCCQPISIYVDLYLVTRARAYSRQTRAVLAELLADPAVGRYGFELARATGLASGTLYPILMRLEERGLLAARWEFAEGRPRHVYRLTAAGLAVAQGCRVARSGPIPVTEAFA
jgi:PadR family transcriptional regulator PadR